MSQALTASHIPQEVYSTLTNKGQVTIPVEVRRYIGIDTNDKIAFVIQPEGTVYLKIPKYPTISSLTGAARLLKKPLSCKGMKNYSRRRSINICKTLKLC